MCARWYYWNWLCLWSGKLKIIGAVLRLLITFPRKISFSNISTCNWMSTQWYTDTNTGRQIHRHINVDIGCACKHTATPHNSYTLLLFCKNLKIRNLFCQRQICCYISAHMTFWLNRKITVGFIFYLVSESDSLMESICVDPYHTLFQTVNRNVDLFFLDTISRHSSKSIGLKQWNLLSTDPSRSTTKRMGVKFSTLNLIMWKPFTK